MLITQMGVTELALELLGLEVKIKVISTGYTLVMITNNEVKIVNR